MDSSNLIPHEREFKNVNGSHGSHAGSLAGGGSLPSRGRKACDGGCRRIGSSPPKAGAPMCYQCRLPGWNEVIERKFPGTYNARRDKLESSWGKDRKSVV